MHLWAFKIEKLQCFYVLFSISDKYAISAFAVFSLFYGNCNKFVPISLPMPTCLIHAVFDLWRIKINKELAFFIFEEYFYLKYGKTRLHFQKMYFWLVLLQICINHSHTHSQWTCGLWDVKQMIFVHDYLKLMDKIWPLSALHLHHRRTSTNDISKQVAHCL